MQRHAVATPLGICEIWYEGDQLTGFRLPPATPPPSGPNDPPPEWVRHLAERVVQHLSGGAQDFGELPYAWTQVSPFQREVYRTTLLVKSGCTCTYGDLASRMGQPPAVSRAVGVALAQNPWPLLVPCHRVVGTGGRMTGFSGPGGIRQKLQLLAIEGSELFADP